MLVKFEFWKFVCLLISYFFRCALMGSQISLHVEGELPLKNSIVCKLSFNSFGTIMCDKRVFGQHTSKETVAFVSHVQNKSFFYHME